MKIISSDEIEWPKLFLDNNFIIVSYQADIECDGCSDMDDVFEKLSADNEFKNIKFLSVDSRNNPVAEEYIKKKQLPFVATFKEGFLVECDNISDEDSLRRMIKRLLEFKIKL